MKKYKVTQEFMEAFKDGARFDDFDKVSEWADEHFEVVEVDE